MSKTVLLFLTLYLILSIARTNLTGEDNEPEINDSDSDDQINQKIHQLKTLMHDTKCKLY